MRALAAALDGPVVVAKGRVDVIAAPGGISSSVCDWEGGLKRSGGQGDTLTGVLGTFLAWRKGYLDGFVGRRGRPENESGRDDAAVCMGR